MLAQPSFQFRTANSKDDYLITKHFYQMWRDIGARDDEIQPNWQEITLQFIEQARQNLQFVDGNSMWLDLQG